MADLAIKIGSVGKSPAYQDGDIIAAFNSRRIRCVHAMHILDPRKAGGGLRAPRNARHISRDFYELTHQYRFERISNREARRVDLLTGEEVVFNERLKIVKGENFAMDVPLYIARRLDHPGHVVFGKPGSEIWYGGRKDFSNATLDLVWSTIQNKTQLKEEDFTQWPAGINDLKSHLFLSVDDFDDATSEDLVAPELDTSDPENPIVLRKRKNFVVWRNFVPSADVSRVMDKSVAYDGRVTP